MKLLSEKKSGIAYGIFRFAIGVNFFMHGATRLGVRLNDFVQQTTEMFEATFLPQWFVAGFSYLLVSTELIAGVFLVLGMFTFGASVALLILMSCFIFGTALLQNWGLLSDQMTYLIAIFLLALLSGNDYFSLDGIRKRTILKTTPE